MDAVSPLLSEDNPSTWAYGQAALQIVSVTIDIKDCGAEAEREGGVEGQCRLCFAAGTPIHTSRGDVPVEQIEVGDEVLAQDRATGKLEYEPVSALTEPHHDKLLNIRVEGERDPLHPSTGHPFWVRRGDAEDGVWMDADAMQVGDRLLTIDGKWRRVTAITPVAHEETVYNFAVDKDHDYFVGETGFLVHNDGGCGCKIALGVRNGLRPSAEKIGASHLLDENPQLWKNVFLNLLGTPGTSFHVNMGGSFGNSTEEMILNEIDSGSNTGWELQQLRNAGRLPDTNFYLPGETEPECNPFE